MHSSYTLSKNIRLFFISLILSILAAAIVLEGYYRYQWSGEEWIDINTEFDQRLGWRNIPSSVKQNQWGSVGHNSLGFRSEELAPLKKKVVLLGDSVAWGYGLSDEDIIATQLQKKIEDEGYQVVNLGTSGFGLGQTYLWLRENIDQLGIIRDVVLILNAENDLLDVASNARYGKSKPFFRSEGEQLQIYQSHVRRYNLRNLFSESILIRRLSDLHPAFRQFFNQLAGDQEMSELESQDVAQKLILAIANVARQNGARFHILNSPSLVDYTEGPIGFAWAEKVIAEQELSKIEIFEGIRGQFKDLQEVYYDQEHYSRKGSLFVAYQIYQAIILNKN